ncbi:MAG: flagellar basal body P-ring protein FlgI, partial [Candidatus Dadabacteria bacterium]
MRSKFLYTLFFLYFLSFSSQAFSARLKDIADIEGVRGNQLFGYGLVVGLNGTGDGKVTFTLNSISNMMERLGVKINPDDIKVKNVAAVIVTAELPPFARPGNRVDVTLSSLGDAKSLQGGTLLFTPLRAADGKVYVTAQGAVTVGGFSVGQGGDNATKNHPTVGRIANGGIVERYIPFDLFQSKRIRVVLRKPDFTTVNRVVHRINEAFNRPLAVALDGASVEIPLVDDLAKDPVGFIAKLEHIEVAQDVGAKVVVNEKTGTIVMGENVTISKVALAHGNINIVIRSETQVSQPNALAQGQTTTVTNTDVNVTEDLTGFNIVGGEVTLGDLVKAL